MLQVVALVVTAIFVWRYLEETEELRRAAQRQLGAADEQSEAQIRRWRLSAEVGHPQGGGHYKRSKKGKPVFSSSVL
jgi:hypothetical protein